MLDRSGRGAICVVGDYLFDATLNGVLRSANNVAEMIANFPRGETGDACKNLISARGPHERPRVGRRWG